MQIKNITASPGSTFAGLAVASQILADSFSNGVPTNTVGWARWGCGVALGIAAMLSK